MSKTASCITYTYVGAVVCSLALLDAAVPAHSAPVSTQAKAIAGDLTIVSPVQVRSEREARRQQTRRAPERSGYATPYGRGQDTVGSLGTDSQGRTFNRFTGQVYYSCMLDEGYGRVRPCDAGGGGGGGGSFN